MRRIIVLFVFFLLIQSASAEIVHVEDMFVLIPDGYSEDYVDADYTNGDKVRYFSDSTSAKTIAIGRLAKDNSGIFTFLSMFDSGADFMKTSGFHTNGMDYDLIYVNGGDYIVSLAVFDYDGWDYIVVMGENDGQPLSEWSDFISTVTFIDD